LERLLTLVVVRFSLKNYQHNLDSYFIVCSFRRIAARYSVQSGRTRSDPAGISRPGSIPLEAILQMETAPIAGFLKCSRMFRMSATTRVHRARQYQQ
jgi:hypothetical protein